MKFIYTLLISLLFFSVPSWAQFSITGQVLDGLTGSAVSQAKVEAASKQTLTGADGRFVLEVSSAGDYTVIVTVDGYEVTSVPVKVTNGAADIGKVSLKPSITQSESGLAEITLSGESDDKDQAVSGVLHSSGDVFTNTASYSFSSMFFKERGYDSEYENVYIEGVPINDGESGRAVYGEWGGLNDVFRNREFLNGIEPGRFSIGTLGGSTNFTTRASKQRKGSKFSYALSNRSYTNRVMFTYSTGLKQNNWAFTVSGSRRWGNEGYVEGTFYDGYAYFVGAEKKFNSRHSLALTAYASPTKRGMSSASTQEVYDMLNNNYYNSSWGYQNGDKRNSRIKTSNEPMIILSEYWTIDEKTTVTSSLAYSFGKSGSTALNWYNARDPRPDYYRSLPGYQSSYPDPVDPVLSQTITNQWLTDPSVRQINWNGLYQANYLSNLEGKQANYILENNITSTNQWYLNSRLNKQINDNSTLNGGIELSHYKGSHYKTLDDLLGSNYWVDIDQYSQRDFQADTIKLQNDLKNPDRIIKKGDRFGYDYDLYSNNATLWALKQYSFPKQDYYIGGSISANQYWRYGNMMNGRDTLTSYHKSEVHSNFNYSIKAGYTYKISGRHYVTINVASMTRSPLLRDAYISPRTTAKLSPGMTDVRILSGDISYVFRYPNLNGRFTLYQTVFHNYSELLRFYDDDLRTFVNMSLTNEDRVHQGFEFGAEAKLMSNLSIVGVFAYGNYRYTNRPTGTRNYDNGSLPDTTEVVYLKNFFVGGSPQIASSLGLHYNKNYWFFDLNANFYDKIWLDVNPQRRTTSTIHGLLPSESDIIKTLSQQQQLDGGMTLDASIGKSIRINSYFLNINFSISNLLDNQKLISGGYEQSRIDFNTAGNRVENLNAFPPKYYYAYGRTYFLNIGFRF
ncbi:MAG: TonB-dependent receptor [Bacteroidetes bacterium]|nr:TonB-dependent receptor [Bacteroidota bacterium]